MIENLLPNVVSLQNLLWKATYETLISVFFSGIFASLIGIPLGILMYSFGKDNVLSNKFAYNLLSSLINILRSIPFIILISAIPWLIRAIAGTTIGVKGAIVALTIGCFPFMARQVELSLLQVDKGVIEAYEAMGFTAGQIIRKVILPEALPYLVQAVTVTLVSLVSFSAVAGSVGGGGLGSFAIQFGYNEFKDDVMLVTVIIILLIVFIIQAVGNRLYRRLRRHY